MGDAGFDSHQLSRESFRLDTFDTDSLNEVKCILAKAGFYYTRDGLKVKCFVCDYELDGTEIDPGMDVAKLHKEKRPECRFAKRLLDQGTQNARPKKFLSYDSLRYEKERLETFIEWPIPWLSTDDLAADGFYYLRTSDHCACVFCRGIVGAWEVGDTPRGEHQRHFPHCPFIRGQPVGNVPLNHSTILDQLPLDGEECPLPPPRCEYSNDEAGAVATPTGGRHMPGSYAECKGPNNNGNVNFDEIGLRQYSGPKRKDYITKESRLKSFARWPERVVQKPDEMAEAGFFYCGLSDHVRCFHCGSGLRNWEIEDKPWEEHARWYPDCNFVLLSKGQKFIDKVRRERPPYLRSAAAKDSKPQKVSASSGKFKPLSEEDLDPLLESDIIQAVKGMGFPLPTIRKALRQKLQQTGLPFFSLEPCIEMVLQVMEEETRQALHGSGDNDNVEEEAVARQSDKMQALHLESQAAAAAASTTTTTTTASMPAVNGNPGTSRSSRSNAVAPVSIDSTSGNILTTIQQSPAVTSTPSASTASSVVTSVATTGSDTPVTSTASVVATVENPPAAEPTQQDNAEVEAMEIDEEPPAETMETQAREASNLDENHSVQSSNLPGNVVAIQEADERMSIADEILKPTQSGPPSLEATEKGKSPGQSLEEKLPDDIKKSCATATQPSQKDIAEELERIRESRTCKICMDAEMDVVFLPCSHMSTCSSCAVTMAQCPICRDVIKYTIKTIFS